MSITPSRIKLVATRFLRCIASTLATVSVAMQVFTFPAMGQLFDLQRLPASKHNDLVLNIELETNRRELRLSWGGDAIEHCINNKRTFCIQRSVDLTHWFEIDSPQQDISLNRLRLDISQDEYTYYKILSPVPLRASDLQGENFSYNNLAGIDFRGSNLRKASFFYANLSRADFRGANLSGADLRGAVLKGCRVDESTIMDNKWRNVIDIVDATSPIASLAGQDLSGAYLGDLNLSKAVLARCNLTHALLPGANLTHANLTEAKLVGANLHGADLTGTAFNRADLTLADLSSANFTDAILVEANLALADLADANLTRTDFTDALLPHRSFYPGIILQDTKLPDQSTMTESDLYRLFVKIRRNGEDAQLDAIDFRGFDFQGFSLKGASLRGSNVATINFSSADLSYADLSGATLTGAVLIETNLTGAELTNADLQGCDLSWATLTDARISPEALANVILYHTIMPDGSVSGE